MSRPRVRLVDRTLDQQNFRGAGPISQDDGHRRFRMISYALRRLWYMPRQFLANIVDTHLTDGSELAAAQRFLIR